MKNGFRKNDGFTLVELLVTILAGSIITLAAVSILLLGLRINYQATATARRQTTTRVFLSVMEDIAAEGKITRVTARPDGWQVTGPDGAALFSYDASRQTIYSGEVPGEDDSAATKMMEGVVASDISIDGKLLTVTVETESGCHSSSVYCRTVDIEVSQPEVDQEVEDLLKPEPDDGRPEQTLTGRAKFLQNLAAQYAITTAGGEIYNPGLILRPVEYGGKVSYISTGVYFSEWYVGGYAHNPGWNAQTPWCACFVSWGLMSGLDGTDTLVDLGTNTRGFANVDSFMNYLKSDRVDHEWQTSACYGGSYTPVPGDLIFFDWTVNNVIDPEHIGAVIKVDSDYVYTIEGNSANRVAIRKYGIRDSRIIGYGVLDWDTTS